MDPITRFKEQQKATWSNFSILESVTATAARRLVRFAGIAALYFENNTTRQDYLLTRAVKV